MEVHYLPPLRKTSRTIRENIFEFLFIFLAVLLGLYADHVRDTYAEKEKTKECAQLLYDDLKTDISNIQQTYTDKDWIEEKYDTAENILATKDLSEYNEFIYYVERYLTNPPVFSSQDITYLQMQSSDKYRYSNNIMLYKKIAQYYFLYYQYKAFENTYTSPDNSDISVIESRLFNPRDLTSLDNPKTSDFQSQVIRPVLKLKPIRRDINNLKLFYIKVNNAKKHTYAMKLLLEKQKVYGLSLMKDLKKEYNLK